MASIKELLSQNKDILKCWESFHILEILCPKRICVGWLVRQLNHHTALHPFDAPPPLLMIGVHDDNHDDDDGGQGGGPLRQAECQSHKVKL